jgi:hypothetical protein
VLPRPEKFDDLGSELVVEAAAASAHEQYRDDER